ncbi:hypothetical protein CHS0354_038005 [Potamilus streckersoni]|uniref:DUF4200 domain-containing protein n=1 Tax=Potamilus streckersoni TaxID=2493646 RepID=A0AAE0TF94_9BIVA|nr:hypothetical protein CHS0354_038005 [Potamilus streckersoni]
MAVTGSYQLDLDHQKKNVFVTQLHEREDEDDVVAFPVVKESGDKLIETGINTLQRTLLLKKEVEVDKVNVELEAKRHEFKQRMEYCAQKQIEVQKKQQEMKDKVTNFEKFLKEHEAKRRRAIQKYQSEVKLKEQKSREYETLCEQMEELKERQKYLEDKLAKYKKFEEYLLHVIDVMPEDYLPVTDDKIKGLMMRHRTLSESNKALIDNLESMSDELEKLKTELDELKQEHNKRTISINSQLSILQQTHDKEQDKNKRLDNKFLMSKGDIRNRRTELGMILMSINNMVEKCHKRPLDELESKQDNLKVIEYKLNRIKDYVNDRSDVAKMATPKDSVGDSKKGSEDHSRRSKPKKTVTLNG